jgi:hypothetical protein
MAFDLFNRSVHAAQAAGQVAGQVAGRAAGQVTGAIRQAAQATGASFQYLLATAKVESNLNPDAKAASSSARGLYQFIDQTWLTTLKEQGPALGLSRYSDAIEKSPSGGYSVADPAKRAEIMNLRSDPTMNAVMAGAFTNHNGQMVASRIGRPASEGELYIAHFLGAAGASRLISLAANSPNASGAAAFPDAAAANRSVFYNRAGQARGAGDVYAELVRRYDVAVQSVSGGSVVASASSSAPRSIASTETLGVVQPYTAVAATAADNRPVFHSLFSSDGPRAPVSSVVADLWGTRQAQQAREMGSSLDLFKDSGTSGDVRGLFTGKS